MDTILRFVFICSNRYIFLGFTRDFASVILLNFWVSYAKFLGELRPKVLNFWVSYGVDFGVIPG